MNILSIVKKNRYHAFTNHLSSRIKILLFLVLKRPTLFCKKKKVAFVSTSSVILTSLVIEKIIQSMIFFF